MSESGSFDNQISQTHLDLVAQIYDLPLQPDGWQKVLDQFAPIMNATLAGVAVHEPLSLEHQLNVMTSNFPPEMLDGYYNMITASKSSPFAIMSQNPKRDFWTETKMLGTANIEEYAARPGIQWLNQNFNVLHGAASCLNLDRAWTDILLIMFPDERGPITTQERMTGHFFLDHFAKAMEISRSFSILKNRFDSVLSALDRFHIGIFILSPNGTVILKNAEADRIISEDDGVSLTRNGHIHPRGSDQRAEMKDAITHAVSTAKAQNNRSESLLALPRRSGKDSYLVEVSPFRDDGEIESLFSGCLVFVIDPVKTDVVSTDGMRKIYGLTPSESEVCRMVAEGFETDAIADTRNITRETVRNYIKQILRKTNTRNRSQLVRLALNVNLPIDAAPSPKDATSPPIDPTLIK